jgi:hypothetical protein
MNRVPSPSRNGQERRDERIRSKGLIVIRLADFCYRRRRFVLAGWVVVLIAVFAASSAFPA